jgi:TPR repeat protein
MRLYQQAVAQGDSRAYVRIGDVHGSGRGSPGTLSRRTGGMPRPRAMGTPRGCPARAQAYERGNGVEADQVRALMRYSLAHAQGYAEAAERVARVRERLDGAQQREAEALAADWLSANRAS